MKTKHLLTTLLTLVACVAAGASRYNPDTELPKLQARLRIAGTSADSVKILYDMYDLQPRAQRLGTGKEIFRVAGNAGDVSAQLDAVRLNSNLYSQEADFARLQSLVSGLPKSQERDETLLFLKLKDLSYASRRPIKDGTDPVSDLIHRLNTTPMAKQNPTQRLLNLYSLTAYMRNVPGSKMLINYMDSLMMMVDGKDYKLYALRNMIYSEASNIYTDAGQEKKAVEADRKLLEVIGGLEKKYSEAGRKYRDYSESKYVVYRRILRNYKALTPAEVDKCYQAIQSLAGTSGDVARDKNGMSDVSIYYNMAKGHYAEALPLLKERLKRDLPAPVLRQTLLMLQTAARETGDSATLISALSDYNQLMERLDKENLSQKYQELQIAYDVNKLKANNERLRMEKVESEVRTLRANSTYYIIFMVVFVVLLIILIYYWSRYRRNMMRINRFAAVMDRQCNILKAEKYSDYDTIGTVSQAPFRTSTDSAVMLRSIFSNVLYVSAIGQEDRERHLEDTTINRVLHLTVDQFRDCKQPSTNLTVTYPDPDFRIFTDTQCMCYVLSHILDYAQRHSGSGDIYMEAVHIPESHLMQVIFRHDGIRIPRGNEQNLFENFVDIDAMIKSDDSVLFICRLIAFLLQCNIAYNPHKEGHAQLVVTIPTYQKPC